MKICMVVLAIVALVSADSIQGRSGLGRSLSSKIVDAIEKLKQQMPCGFEKYGIPPLAPLKIEQKAIALKKESLSIEGDINKMSVYGMNEFNVTEMKVNVIFSKISFSFEFPKISVKSLYDLETVAKAYGLTVNIKGAGNLSFDIDNLKFKGTMKYSILGPIKINSLTIAVSIGNVDSNIEGILGEGLGNRKLNELIEEFCLLAINENQDIITKNIENSVVPLINDALDGKTLGDLIGSIGGSGESNDVCVPPKDY